MQHVTHHAQSDAPAAMLRAMATAKRFNQWMAHTLAPYISGDALELGAGIGNLSVLLSPLSHRYIAADIEHDYLAELNTRLRDQTNATVTACDVLNSADLEPFRRRMDTVVCLNVLEHIEDDVAALRNMHSCLRPGGRAVILVPQGNRAFGTLDAVLDHCRRYSNQELAHKLAAAGFRVERTLNFNRITYPAWLFNGRILRRRHLGFVQLQIFDALVPLWRRIDRFLPWPPTSLIAIGMRED